MGIAVWYSGASLFSDMLSANGRAIAEADGNFRAAAETKMEKKRSVDSVIRFTNLADKFAKRQKLLMARAMSL